MSVSAKILELLHQISMGLLHSRCRFAPGDHSSSLVPVFGGQRCASQAPQVPQAQQRNDNVSRAPGPLCSGPWGDGKVSPHTSTPSTVVAAEKVNPNLASRNGRR